jgi:hypothetical protein
MVTPFTVSIIIAIVIAVILLAFGAVILWQILRNEIDLSSLLSEGSTGKFANKASLSRLQFLIFTFVIAGLYLVVCIETGSLVEVPGSVLGLLGISGGSYAVSKGISQSKPADTDE